MSEQRDPVFTPEMICAAKLARLADGLKWSVRERYSARDTHILKGGNELESLYAQLPTPEAAQELCEGLNRLIAPLRRADVARRISEMRELLDKLEAGDH